MSEQKLPMKSKDIIFALDDLIQENTTNKNRIYLHWWKENEKSRLRRSSQRYAWINKFVPKSSTPLKVLDMGTGFGHLAILIKRLYHHDVISADVETTIELKKRFQREGIPFHKCDFLKFPLPFHNNYFNVVLFTDALFLIPLDPRQVLREFNRILKNGGLLILDVLNYLSLYNRIRTFFGREKTDWNSPYPHYHEYTVKEISNLLVQTDFTAKQMVLCNTTTPEDISFHYPINSLAFYLFEALSRLSPNLKDTVIAIGQKNSITG